MYQKYETITNDGYSLVDNMTGEIKEFKQVKKVSKQDFMLVFLYSIPEMCKLDGNHLKILMLCWKYSSFNPVNSEEGNIIHNDRFFKDAIKKDGMDLSDSSIDVYISRLCKKEFLIKRCRGSYMLNPKYFFKGSISDASKMQLNIISEQGNPTI